MELYKTTTSHQRPRQEVALLGWGVMESKSWKHIQWGSKENSIAYSGTFRSDKTISQYCGEILDTQPLPVPHPSTSANERARSFSNLQWFDLPDNLGQNRGWYKGVVKEEDLNLNNPWVKTVLVLYFEKYYSVIF